MTIFVRSLSIVCMLILISNTVFAQSNKDKELLLLLETYPELLDSKISVYTTTSKDKIADVILGDTKILVNEPNAGSEDWSKIKLQEKIVPIWVSDKFVQQKGNQAVVTTDLLTARLSPSLDSGVVTVLSQGYSASILEHQNSFIKINAPTDTSFLVLKEDLNKVSANIVVTSNKQKDVKEYTSSSSDQTDFSNHKPLITQVSNSSQGQQLQAQTISSTVINDATQAHIIAPGDSISLLVFGEPDLSKENVRVPENGNVSLPLIGVVSVAGKTTRQIEDNIQTILSSGYVKNPRLSVSIFSYRPIFIRGAVQDTGAFPYTQGLSVAKALALAGGALNSAKPEGIRILRDGKEVQSGLRLDSQYQVASGDVITVDEEQGVREDENLFIYLHGEVASPGEYRYRKGLTVEKAIVLSGGFTLRASRRKISITRYINVGENQQPEELKNVKLYTTIMPGDIIKVRASLF